MLKKEFDVSLFIKEVFHKYYRSLSNFYIPKSLEKREFGFIFFDNGTMRRHISFNSGDKLLVFLRSNVPKHVFYSSAYYEYPYMDNMSQKKWLGADLIFDIDVDHIPTVCKVFHDVWKCLDCGREGKGNVDVCLFCGSERIRKKTWVCSNCIERARNETLKLIDFLVDDFGFAYDELEIFFSGHRGFHIHIDKDLILEMDQDSRREIADYIRGVGLDTSFFLKRIQNNLYVYAYDFESKGWYSRIIRGIYSFLLKSSRDDLEKIGLVSERIDDMFKKMRIEGLDALFNVALTLEEWKALLRNAVLEEGCIIDEKVTIDIKRLIRLPDSLHGKTGLRVVRLSFNELENEDILDKAIVFRKGSLRLYVKKVPERVLDWKFDNVKNSVIDVPMYLGIYLLQNGGDDISLIKVL